MAATDAHATIEEPLEAVLPVRSVPRLYNEDQSPLPVRADCVCVCVCVGEGQFVSECLLESPSEQGEWPVVVRPLLSLKRRPHFKTCKSFGKYKNMVVGPNGTETKIYCAGEGQ
jgi:hypothetical protein